MTICWLEWRARLRRLIVSLALLCLPGAAPAAAFECQPLALSDSKVFGELYFERGLLWEVTAPGGKRSLLFGTMHVGDPRVHEAATLARHRLAEARVLLLEVVLDGAAMNRLQAAMFLAPNEHLGTMLGAPLFDRVVEVLSNYGMSRRIAERMKPWAVFATLSLPAGDTGLALDFDLQQRAGAAGIDTLGLETVDEQISVFESIELDDQIAIVQDMACHHERFQDDMQTMIADYAVGNLRGLVEISFQYETQNDTQLMDALLWRRNARMLDRMMPELTRGGAFVAVGALHLPGVRGILRGLQQRGFEVQALY